MNRAIEIGLLTIKYRPCLLMATRRSLIRFMPFANLLFAGLCAEFIIAKKNCTLAVSNAPYSKESSQYFFRKRKFRFSDFCCIAVHLNCIIIPNVSILAVFNDFWTCRFPETKQEIATYEVNFLINLIQNGSHL